MKAVITLLAIGALCQGAAAQTPECKSITDPATRLACYDKAYPPIATYPIPPPKPAARPAPAARPEPTVAPDAGSDDDALVTARMQGICRGC
jgi:hypothetical protein